MNTRNLLSNAVLYGLADAIVLVVGGFLLLPLYTRVLSQSDYGIYVIVRANIEIFTYLLYLGLPSAVARVYFIYRKTGQQAEYLSSVVMFYLLCLTLFGALLSLWGPQFWTLLSPTTPVHPYLNFTFAIAAVGFLGAIGTMWLRLEGQAAKFAALQICAAVLLAGTAMLNLVVFGDGLPGLLIALLISALCTALVLPLLFGRTFRPVIRLEHIKVSMRYAMPILGGYIAYFVLNRIGTLILQRQVAVDQIAIFGLAQQLAMLVTIAATAFGMAMQPAVYGAEPDRVTEVLERSSRILMLLIVSATSVFLLFSAELFALVAPPSYAAGHDIMLIMLLANFAYSFCQMSSTALLYYHRPKTSAAVTVSGAVVAALLSATLIPVYGLYGAAYASLGAILFTSFLSHALARQASGYSYFRSMSLSLVGVTAVALLASWLGRLAIPAVAAWGIKAAICLAVFAVTYLLYIRKLNAKPCNP